VNTNDQDKFYLWEGSSYSVFVIPINTLLISIGLRLLFCKLNVEVMKTILIVDLLLIYICTIIGLICYLIASSNPNNGDNFKQNFFVQYIILAIALVLGFLTQFIALLLISCKVMRSMQESLSKNAVMYQEEFDREEQE
jgi:O-antigen ligase